MLRLMSANVLAGPATLEVKPGQYAALMLRITGTNAGGATITNAPFGNITMYKSGRPFGSISLADLQILNNIDLGLVEAASAIGAAYSFSAMILSSYCNDGNVFDFSPDDEGHIDIDLSGIAAAPPAAGVVELFGIPEDGIQKYLPQIFTNTPNIGAASVQVVPLKYENISRIYFTVPANVNNISILKDKYAYVECTFADLIAQSNMDNRLEAAFVLGAVVNLHRSGALSEALSDDINLQIIAGAAPAVPHVICVSLDFTPNDLARGAAAVNNKAQAVFARKIEAGRGRPVTVAKQLNPSAVQVS